MSNEAHDKIGMRDSLQVIPGGLTVANEVEALDERFQRDIANEVANQAK
jgi:hypothetical protein